MISIHVPNNSVRKLLLLPKTSSLLLPTLLTHCFVNSHCCAQETLAPTMGSTEDAVTLKNKGNDAFKNHDWNGAIEYYTQAIESNPTEPTFYTNRAQVTSCHSCLKGIPRLISSRLKSKLNHMVLQ